MNVYGNMVNDNVYEMRAYGATLTANDILMHKLISDRDPALTTARTD